MKHCLQGIGKIFFLSRNMPFTFWNFPLGMITEAMFGNFSVGMFWAYTSILSSLESQWYTTRVHATKIHWYLSNISVVFPGKQRFHQSEMEKMMIWGNWFHKPHPGWGVGVDNPPLLLPLIPKLVHANHIHDYLHVWLLLRCVWNRKL